MNPVSSQSDSSPPPTQTPYNHPMQDGFTSRGIIFQEVKDDLNGRRYVSGEQITIDENGNEIVFSGISTIERRPLTQDELDDMVATEQRGYQRNYNSAPIISPGLEQMMSSASQDATFYVHVNFDSPLSYKPLIYRMEESIALGEVNTFEDRQLVRNEHLLTQQEEVRQVSTPIQNQITNLGGKVASANKNLFSLNAILTASQITNLANYPGIKRINKLGTINENDMDGYEISLGTQMWTSTTGQTYVQYLDNESTAQYYGNKGYPNRIKVGVLEHSAVQINHPGFKDQNNNSRIEVTRRCYGYYYYPWGCYWSWCREWRYKCESGAITPANPHPTAVAGIAAGDITQGQDNDYPGTNTLHQIQRSGYARRAGLYLWAAESDGAISKSFDDIINYDPHVLNMSIEYGGVDQSCNGTDSLSQDANGLFEAGIPLIYAAGNDRNKVRDTGEDICLVESPGSAMGVFVVGGHGQKYGSEWSVRYGSMFNPGVNSSRGGTTSYGRGRTIIDLTAAYWRQFYSSHIYNILPELNEYKHQCPDWYCFADPAFKFAPLGGTSFAAPTVAAGAALLMDFYKDKYSSALEDPGKLYAHLLLMGDRQTTFASYQPDSDFDNHYGAGRFKMKRWDAYGLDSPWGWGSWTTCIDNGQIFYKKLYNGDSFPANTDTLKAVITWYDKRHEDGTAIDNINLHLEECQFGIWFSGEFYCTDWDIVPLNRQVDPGEEKERIFKFGNLSGKRFRLAITGADVTSDDAGCGTNSMRVHITWFYEDSSRDDSDGPNSDIDPE